MADQAPVAAPSPAGEVVAATQTEGAAAPPGDGGKKAPPKAAPPEPTELDLAQRAANRARKGSSKVREAQAKIDALSHTAAMAQAKAAQFEKQLGEVRSFQDQLRSDPYKALRALGMTDKQLTERVVQDGSLESLVAETKRELADTKRELEEIKSAGQREKMLAAEKAAETNLVTHVKASAAQYPHLSRQPPAVLIDLVRSALNRLVQMGQPIANRQTEVLQYLESQYRSNAPPVIQPAPTVEAPSDPPAQKPKAKTLTNGLGNRKFSFPANYDQLSEREQKKIDAEFLRSQGLAK